MGFRLVTLNLNGIRSAASKGFVQWAEKAGADCMCVQEIKAQQPDVAGRFDRIGALQGHFHFAQKKGYSGVGLYARRRPSEVIVGLRPEAFEDASLARETGGPVVTATVDVLESLGSDAYVYFSAEGGPVTTAELEELATDSGARDTGARGAQQIVARLNAATRAREGAPVELRVDMGKAHVFDPSTGTNLTHAES